MTVIAIKKEKNKISISADKQCTNGQFTKEVTKIKKVGNIIFGGSGYLNELQIMERFLLSKGYDEKTIKSESELFKFMGNFYSYLKDQGVIDSRDNWEKTVINTFVFIIENLGKVYEYNHWCLIEINDYLAIGSGGTVARTVLSMGGTTKEAVEKANELTLYCGMGCDTIEIEINKKIGKK